MHTAVHRRALSVLLFTLVVAVSAVLTTRADAAVNRPPTPVEVVGQPIAVTVADGALTVAGAVSVTGTVAVDNLPATQTVDGTVDIGNLPATQSVDGTVDIGNLPATQTVDGTVDIGNLPAIQDVRVVDGGGPAATAGGGTFSANSTFGPATVRIVVPAGEYLTDFVVLDASTASDCIFNFRTTPGDGRTNFSLPRGRELQGNPISLSTGLAGPLEIAVACGSTPDTFANGFYTTSTQP